MSSQAGSKHDIQGLNDGIKAAAFKDAYLEAGGLRLHYVDYGSAGRPPMLCVHGGGAHTHWFDFVASDFTDHYHVYAIDQRGHGDSAWSESGDYSYERFAADLAEAVEKLDLRDFVLVGHSMGGMVSLVYAATHPGRVSRLVVVDSSLKLSPDFVEQMKERGTRTPSSYATLDELAARYRLRPPGTTAPAERIRYLGGYAGRQHTDGTWKHKFDRNVYAHRKFVDGLACWNRIKIPALLVRGMLSPRITPEIFREVKSRCPQVELAEVPNSHHHVTLDNPAVFSRDVNAFLKRHR